MVDTSHLQIADRLSEFRNEYEKQYDRLADTYGWTPGVDVRLTGLSKIANSLDFARVGLYLGRNKHYKRIPEQKILPNENVEHSEKNAVKKNILNEFHLGLKRSFFLSLHMSIESTIRVIARALGLEKESFFNTYNNLLNDLNPAKKDEFINLLEIIRHIRNTIHNNGIYNKRTKSITYGTIIYTFTQNNPVELRWKDIDDFLIGVLELLVVIVEDDKIYNLSNNIMEDPSASSI